MIRIILFYIALFTLSSTLCRSQHKEYCYDAGKADAIIDEKAVREYLRTYAGEMRSNNKDTVIINPVILKSETIGSQSFSEERLVVVLEVVNDYFRYTNIHFQVCGEPQIFESDDYYNLTIDEASELNTLVHEDNTINVYIAETISQVYPDGNVGLFCGIASFPGPVPKERYILLDGSCLAEPSLLAHEIGHFYGLFHTHETSFGIELVNKLNCEVAGDLLCDTPADPLLNITNVSFCRYFGEQVDPLGQSYRPDTKNLMSYSPDDCRNAFSWQQLMKMRAIHENENSYLRSDCTFPDFTVKVDTFFASFVPGQRVRLPVVISNKGTWDTYGLEVKAYFSDDPGKKENLLESKLILFPPDRSSVSMRMDLQLPIDLPENMQYIIVEVDGDRQISELNENNNEAVLAYRLDYGRLSDMLLYPNPAHEKVRVFFRDVDQLGPVIIDIIDTNGRKVRTYQKMKRYNTFQAELDLSDLQTGLYFVHALFNGNRNKSLLLIKL